MLEIWLTFPEEQTYTVLFQDLIEPNPSIHIVLREKWQLPVKQGVWMDSPTFSGNSHHQCKVKIWGEKQIGFV
ncbi:hypothetical protein STEG23_015829 [Scotinomys teguina]